mgnify:CR=1 FL=1
MIIPAVSKPAPTSASGAPMPEKTTIAEMTTPIVLSPTINPDASNTPQLLGRLGLWRSVGAAIEQPAHNRADNDHQRALRRQINSETNRERGYTHVSRRPCENLI